MPTNVGDQMAGSGMAQPTLVTLSTMNVVYRLDNTSNWKIDHGVFRVWHTAVKCPVPDGMIFLIACKYCTPSDSTDYFVIQGQKKATSPDEGFVCMMHSHATYGG